MKKIIAAVASALVCISAIAMEKTADEVSFYPVEHASMVIRSNDATIYIDPVGSKDRYVSFPGPEIILVTHIHRDHLAPDLIKEIKDKGTEIIGPQSVIDKLGYGTVLKTGAKMSVRGMEIEAVPAYNITRDRLKYHPKERGDNGYVLTIGEKRIYVSGDTEDTQEMRELVNIDIAFICVNLPYTMTVEQAASAVLEIKPKTVTPYHYRGPDGMSDLELFGRLVREKSDIEVRSMEWYSKKGD